MNSIRAALPDEQREAIRLSLASAGARPLELATRTEAFLAHVRATSPPGLRHWFATDPHSPRQRLAACTYLETSPGTAQVIVPDGVPLAVGTTTATALLGECVRTQEERRVRMLQCLVNPAEDAGLADILAGAGFSKLATLRYLELSPLSTPPALPSADDGGEWLCYSDALRREFVDTIARTYVGSADCPALASIRDAADAVETHRRTGIFRPHRWLLIRVGGVSAGCVLLNEIPMRSALELTYMGVIPEYRSRGVGSGLLGRAISLGASEGFGALCLAVDDGNAAARRLYGAAGFRDVFRREAWIRVGSVAGE